MGVFLPVSPTSLGKFVTCERQFWYVYKSGLASRSVSSPQMEYGNRVHDVIKKMLKDNKPVPADLKHLEPIVKPFSDLRQHGELIVEESMAVTRDWKPVKYGDPKRYIYLRLDCAFVAGPTALYVDWKTGKKPREDGLQERLGAIAMFAKYPEIQEVHSTLVFTECNVKTPVNVFTRTDVVDEELLDLLHRYETAQVTDKYEPRPSGLCKAWCDNIDCEHNGKRR